MKLKKERKPATVHCPFCPFSVSSWFHRERAHRLGHHIEDKHKNAMDKIVFLGSYYQRWMDTFEMNYHDVMAEIHAHLLSVNPHKETAK